MMALLHDLLQCKHGDPNWRRAGAGKWVTVNVPAELWARLGVVHSSALTRDGGPQPFHKDASHVPPEYRDGWNACHEAFIEAQAIAAPPTLTDAVLVTILDYELDSGDEAFIRYGRRVESLVRAAHAGLSLPAAPDVFGVLDLALTAVDEARRSIQGTPPAPAPAKVAGRVTLLREWDGVWEGSSFCNLRDLGDTWLCDWPTPGGTMSNLEVPKNLCTEPKLEPNK